MGESEQTQSAPESETSLSNVATVGQQTTFVYDQALKQWVPKHVRT